ncbi:MAG: tRNA pseudouridine(13) synthase TruD [Candidatus Diapherotrites archaeon]|jgi:tRNA pseudouridine13 synthase|uniref:Probable tRNA pseudouridine synthase D n=1 Tax=Candidatus Iainarchaeum sp. TaxID=3101447 RepID=A0A8T5GDP2_9ARCH|nr:tRNA pseudouridine(13) synthase TruD [Candidatus Diapherotrites archaeon]MBT7240962.1 tRNA pseudouridine(13) synthase TruD [Candidatus Diapherotrites archaeon]
MSDKKPLNARARQRYADFIVEEVYEKNKEREKCEVNWFTIDFDKRDLSPLSIPTKTAEHLIVEVEKINTDTNRTIALIARGLGMSKSRIGYAGMKDKRGITAQRISIFDPSIAKVEKFGVKGLKVKSASWGERLELGDLLGNDFTIILRDISESEEEIKTIIESFIEQSKNGLPNYFGTQRFGGKRNVTHKVGKLLMQGKHEEAIMLYLTHTFEDEKIELKSARVNLAKTKDFARALKEFPRDAARTEVAMLNFLVKKPNDYVGAFGALSKKIRILFVHAYQSYIFNEIIKKRIEKYGVKGIKAIDGDILNEEGVPLGLLPGYESKFASGEAGEIEKEVMEKEGVDFSFFKVRSITELSSKGHRKEISIIPKDFKFVKTMDDEFNEGKKAAMITFYLSKGNYATTILQELVIDRIF